MVARPFGVCDKRLVFFLLSGCHVHCLLLVTFHSVDRILVVSILSVDGDVLELDAERGKSAGSHLDVEFDDVGDRMTARREDKVTERTL